MISAPPCSQTTTGRTTRSSARWTSTWTSTLPAVLYVYVVLVKAGSAALAVAGPGRTTTPTRSNESRPQVVRVSVIDRPFSPGRQRHAQAEIVVASVRFVAVAVGAAADAGTVEPAAAAQRSPGAPGRPGGVPGGTARV